MQRIIFLGGGGYAKEVADIVSLNNDILLGYYAPEKGNLDAKYLGQDSNLTDRNDVDGYFPAVGSVSRDTHSYREKIVQNFEKLNIKFCNIFSPSSNISSKAKFSIGTYVAPNVNISPDVIIGGFSIIGANSVLSHDVIIGKNVHIAPSSTINGNVVIEDNVLIGAGAIIFQGVKIGKNSIIGAGSIVMIDVKSNSTVFPPLSRISR